MNWTGLVLTGGASERMGRDKATLEVDGVAMARRVADAMVAAGAARVVTVGGDKDALERLHLENVVDRWPGEGPLAGLVAGLEAIAADAHGPDVVCYAPCDLYAPAPRAFATLVEALVAAAPPVNAALPEEPDGRQHPAPAALRVVEVVPTLRAAFDESERTMHRALRRLAIVRVVIDRRALEDADSPADLERLADG